VTAHDFAWMALLLGAAGLVAALCLWRTSNPARRRRLAGAVGAAFGGGSLLLMSVGALP
jgi:CHASE2 domain-containing sensor protein